MKSMSRRGHVSRENWKALKILFPRHRWKRRWHPTERWRSASQQNLAKAPRLRTREASERIKDAINEWLDSSPDKRPTQTELADKLGVTKQYVNKYVRWRGRSALADLVEESAQSRDTQNTGDEPRAMTTDGGAAVPRPEPVTPGHAWDCSCGVCNASRPS